MISEIAELAKNFSFYQILIIILILFIPKFFDKMSDLISQIFSGKNKSSLKEKEDIIHNQLTQKVEREVEILLTMKNLIKHVDMSGQNRKEENKKILSKLDKINDIMVRCKK